MAARLVCVALVSVFLPAQAGAQCQSERPVPLSVVEALPGLDLESLVTSADIIALGTLDEICNRGPASLNARVVTGKVSVRQILKGPTNLEAIAFESPVLESAILNDGKPHRYAIFFFRYRGNHIIFANSFYPMLRAVVAPRRAVSAPLDTVIEAWTEVLRWRDEPLQMKRGVIVLARTETAPKP